VFPAKDTTLTKALDGLVKGLRREQKAVGGLEGAWDAVVPAGLASACTPAGVRAGVLTVRSLNASARYKFEQWLRGGGEDRLKAACSAGIQRVRVQ
jgi:hypothetical protein